MRTDRLCLFAICLWVAPSGCADIIDSSLDASFSDDAGATPASDVTAGAAYVAQRGCPICHDPGDGSLSGGSTPVPGTNTYGANLTPDPMTGIGDWTDDEIARAIRSGLDDQDQALCPAMPHFATVGDGEITDIIAFLRSLPPVVNGVPTSFCPPLKSDPNAPTDGGISDDAALAMPAMIDLAMTPAPENDLAVVDLATPLADLSTPPDLAIPDDANLAAACAVTINEVQTGGINDAYDEFVELYNSGNAPFDLTGYKLVYRSALGVTDVSLLKFAGEMIPAQGYFVCGNAQYVGAADLRYTGGLAASGGGLALRNGSGLLVDSLGWGNAQNDFVESAAAPAPPPAKSIERLPDGNDSNDNAKDFSVATPTPGATNR